MKSESTNKIIAQNLLALLNAKVTAAEWNRLLEMVEQIQDAALNRAADVCHKAGGDWKTNIQCQNAILNERSRRDA
jgi:hypothetical protein